MTNHPTRILIDQPVEPYWLDCLKGMPNVSLDVIEATDEPRALPTDLIQDKTVLFCTHPPDNLEEMASLKLIQINSAGYAQVLGRQLVERNIRVCNAQGVNDVPIAEWNIAMMFQLARDMRGMFRNQLNKVWDRSARFQAELRGSRVGMWGYGGIGRETTRLAKQMGLHVRVLERTAILRRDNSFCLEGTGDPDGILPDEVFVAGQEMDFLHGLDFLIIGIPLTRHTEGLIGERELRALPPTAYVLNPARGPIIQEAALLRALREGWIAGAALDTHYHYPMPPDHPLWEFPNVIMTPHISGSSQSTHFQNRIWSIFVENVRRFMQGTPLLNELTRQQLSGD